MVDRYQGAVSSVSQSRAADEGRGANAHGKWASMHTTIHANLHPLTVEVMRSPGPAVPRWAAELYLEVEARLLDEAKPFPCFYATRALKAGGMRVAFIEDPSDASCLDAFASVLADYTEDIHAFGSFTSLIAMVHPRIAHETVDEYHAWFWDFMQQIHDRDRDPWPSGVALETDHPLWEFSFGGEAMFVLASGPAYDLRASRRTSGILLSFQPRYMFDRLIAEPRKLKNARDLIRTRSVAFDDGLDPHPCIGVYGDPSNREWVQYVIPDDNRAVSGGCPFSVRGQAAVPERAAE